jgi:hypothetical protein
MQMIRTMDCGDGLKRADNGCVGRGPVAKTANYTILKGDAGTIFTNSGAGGAVTFTLPAVTAGMKFNFIVVAAQTLTVQAAGTAKINNSAAAGTYAAAGSQAGVGNVEVFSDGVNWFVRGSGTWVTT